MTYKSTFILLKIKIKTKHEKNSFLFYKEVVKTYSYKNRNEF